jgi:uncharacterized membrane protein YeaQ/YmgE (transglycosylase-associated protein family)
MLERFSSSPLLILLAAVALCGVIGKFLVSRTAGGQLGSAVVGLIGAFVGIVLARSLHLPDLFTFRLAGYSFPILWLMAGWALFVAALRLFRR